MNYFTTAYRKTHTVLTDNNVRVLHLLMQIGDVGHEGRRAERAGQLSWSRDAPGGGAPRRGLSVEQRDTAHQPAAPSESVHEALFALAESTYVARPERREAEPSQVRQSIQRDGLISFIDGRSYKTLKRHLTAHGLTPERYRVKYGLPADYPMVAPGYAAKRSQIAKAIQLGHKAA